MTANDANGKHTKQHKPTARRSQLRTERIGLVVSRYATDKEIARMRDQLKWFRVQGFTFLQMEHDLGKSGGWCNKVLRGVGRYKVTSIDVMVIEASYRSALRLYKRSGHKYGIMRSIIQQAGGIMRDVEELAECV